MTYIISSNSLSKKIIINPVINRKIKELHRKLVDLSFSHGKNSEEYLLILKKIHQLRSCKD